MFRHVRTARFPTPIKKDHICKPLVFHTLCVFAWLIPCAFSCVFAQILKRTTFFWRTARCRTKAIYSHLGILQSDWASLGISPITPLNATESRRLSVLVFCDCLTKRPSSEFDELSAGRMETLYRQELQQGTTNHNISLQNRIDHEHSNFEYRRHSRPTGAPLYWQQPVAGKMPRPR